MQNVLSELKIANPERCKIFGHTVEQMTVLFWDCAVGGETGELLNLIKKRERGDVVDTVDIAYEIADIVIYLDLLCTKMGIDLQKAIVQKFNEVSVKRGSPIML